MTDPIALRRLLHRFPEISGNERATSARILSQLWKCAPDQVITGLGGHGIAAIFRANQPGPRVMFRAELDALPIQEQPGPEYISEIKGVAHLCGHDGHMAMLIGLGQHLKHNRPSRGEVVLLFQPAEETGEGAAAIIADPKFAEITPDYAFAIHNLPGLPLGAVECEPGPVCCASLGLRVVLRGKEAHASQPETGLSPAESMAKLMQALPALSTGGNVCAPDFALVTLCHARLGQPAYGVAPGEADLFFTLRALKNDRLQALRQACHEMISATAQQSGLTFELSDHEVFETVENDAEATQELMASAQSLNMRCIPTASPQRFSEDFGRFSGNAKTAMIFLGAGENHPALHNPDYDFPDALLPLGTALFIELANRLTQAERA